MTAIQSISKKYGQKLSKYSENENAEKILTYIIEVLINNFIWLLLVFILGSTLNLLNNTLIILLVYMPLRSRFGGSHAETFGVCLLLSTIVPLALGYTANRIILELPIIALIYIFSYITAFKLGVVDTLKKTMKPEKKKKFQKQGLIILTVIFAIHMFFIDKIIVSNCISIGVLISFLNLYIKKNKS